MIQGAILPRVISQEGKLVLGEGPGKKKVQKDSYYDDYQGVVYPAHWGTENPHWSQAWERGLKASTW